MKKDETYIVHGLFNDDDVLINSIKSAQEKGFKVKEVYSPFPIHKLNDVIGLKSTRISYSALISGLVGLLLSVWMIWYMMIFDWPQNIGGKPIASFIKAMPAFVPVIFEIIVLFAVVFMVISYFFKNKLFPGNKKGNPDVRTTDNMFLVEFILNNDTKQIVELLKDTGAVEVKVFNVSDKKEIKFWQKSAEIISLLMIAITIISCNSNAPKRNPADVFMPDMYKSVAYEPYSENSMLKPVLGTIKRGFMPYEIDNTLQGYNNALASLKMPIKQTAFNLKQGKELYNIYCISCHGKNGDGNGKLVLNEKILGIPEYSKTKLPNITEGSIFHVITYGKNMMGSHSSQLTATERWQIVQYVLKLRE